MPQTGAAQSLQAGSDPNRGGERLGSTGSSTTSVVGGWEMWLGSKVSLGRHPAGSTKLDTSCEVGIDELASYIWSIHGYQDCFSCPILVLGSPNP
jgi:hypothetical protein